MTTPSLEDWVTSHLGAFFPTSTAPKEDMEDGQDWFANAFNRAFAPDASLTLATIEPPEDDPDKKLIAQKLAETTPGQGDEVKQVSGTEAVDALRELAAGAPRVEFQDVKKAKCEDDQNGVVEGTMLLTRTLAFRIRVSHAQTVTTVRFSATVAAAAIDNEGSDPRRIVSYAQTAESHRKPTNFHPISQNPQHAEGGPRRGLPVQREQKEEL